MVAKAGFAMKIGFGQQPVLKAACLNSIQNAEKGVYYEAHFIIISVHRIIHFFCNKPRPK
jgi:hypothetical protein